MSPRPKKHRSPPRTKGWARASPKRGKQREKLLSKCGSKSFLSPKNLKFPVMTSDCKYSPAGLQSAYNRAKQWNYPKIAAKAKKLLNDRFS
jgi:hypothetical protein